MSRCVAKYKVGRTLGTDEVSPVAVEIVGWKQGRPAIVAVFWHQAGTS